MDSIPKRRENDMPHFTEDSLQRIIVNPFYAITVAPQLTEAVKAQAIELSVVRGKSGWG